MTQATQDSFLEFEPFDPGPIPGHRSGDVEMAEADEVLDTEVIGMEVMTEKQPSPNRLIVAVDFGTTFTSVAYATVNNDSTPVTLSLRNIKCVSNYPDNQMIGNTYDPEVTREEVPTELWYNVAAPKTSKASIPSPQSTSLSSIPELMSDSDMDGEFTDDEDREHERMFWGFGVQKHFKKVDVDKDGTTRLTRFKLMLHEKADATQPVRMEIGHILKKLKRNGIDKGAEELITDYLQQLFVHTKAFLQESNVLRENMAIEFVLCIPAVWPSKGCRILQASLTKAVKHSGLGSLTNNSLDNLFIVSEPEAAAACVLAEDNNDIMVS
jgi:hypothetical protein